MKKKKTFPFMKKSKKKQPKVGHVVKGEKSEAPYGIATDMKHSINY